MLGSQMVLMQSIHGGPLNGPTLNGLDALRIIGYWWRQRGRFGKGWIQALNKLKASGIPPTTASAFKVFTQAQSEIVWECAREATEEMRRIKNARNLPPGVFSDRQSLADAKAVAKRYLDGNYTGKIPKALQPKPRRATAPRKIKPLPPPPEIPEDLWKKIPRVKRPRLNISGKVGWLILAALLAKEWESD